MKRSLKKALSLALLAFLLACAVNLPLPGQFPTARAEGEFDIDENGVLVGYNGPGGYVRIPHGVEVIGDGVFSGKVEITGVSIPNTVKTIGKKAFYGCTNLKKVVLPKGIEVIEYMAFELCTGLAAVTIPNMVGGVIGQRAFHGCTGLKKVTISKGAAEIGDGAFAYCSGLAGVSLPNTVEAIGSEAFEACTSLKKVAIPPKVTVIRDSTFFDCASLKKATLPKGVTEIESMAFHGCTSLTSIAIPNAVTRIGTYAFSGCRGLTGVTIPNAVTEIGEMAFQNCTGLTSVTIGNGVRTIGAYAFCGCSGLTSIVIPDSVETIGDEAFWECPNLNFVTLPSGQQDTDFPGDPDKMTIPENLLPRGIFLREGQSMVLPRFKGARVEWSVEGEGDGGPIARIIKNNAVRGETAGEGLLKMTVQEARGKALTLNGQPLKPGKTYEIHLRIFEKGEEMVRKVAVNPRKLIMHPWGDWEVAEHGRSTALDLAFTPAAFNDSDEWKENCLFVSSNPQVAQVRNDGTVFAIRPGKAAITAYAPNMKTAKVNVTVKGWVTSLRLKDGGGAYVNKLTLEKGQSRQLAPEFNEDAALRAVRWTSSKPAVAFVDGNGRVYAMLKGTARITATALDGSNKKATVIVTVTEGD